MNRGVKLVGEPLSRGRPRDEASGEERREEEIGREKVRLWMPLMLSRQLSPLKKAEVQQCSGMPAYQLPARFLPAPMPIHLQKMAVVVWSMPET